MGYKKTESVPSIVIDYQSAGLFQCLDKNEKEAVWDAVMNYVDIARHREPEKIEPRLQEGLSKLAYKTFDGMINSIDYGFATYWKTCEKNSERIKKRWEKMRSDTTVYHGIPQDTNSIPQDTEIETETDIEHENISYIPYPPYRDQIMNSEKRDVMINIVKMFQEEGFTVSEDDENEIARKIKFDLFDEEYAKYCIAVCKKREKIGVRYALGIFNRLYDGWDNNVI